MREALLLGPLVSFETVVPDPHARRGAPPLVGADASGALWDRTFNLTSVPGVVEEGQEEGQEEVRGAGGAWHGGGGGFRRRGCVGWWTRGRGVCV